MKTLIQNTNRWLFWFGMAFVAAFSLLASTASAVDRIIEGQAGNQWSPKTLNAAVGDVLEWKIAGGFHGVRITNWAVIKDHVEVEAVPGQHPFDATTGQNAAGTGTVGQVLVRLKIKTAPPAPGKITYDCVVHGPPMNGDVTVGGAAPPATVKTIEGQAGNQWNPNALNAAVGDVVEWKIAGGFHGVRITNWVAIKDHVEVETVAGQHPFDTTTGQNAVGTGTAGQVLLRLKIKTAPPAPGKITYDCVVHGPPMNGDVTVGGAAPPATVKTIEGQAGNQWNPNALNAAVGDVVEWKIAGGFHGVRITNWVAIKDHVEVETVAGQHPFDTTTGQNAVGTGTAGQVLLRLKIKTAPPAPGKITYDCVVHGPPMNGDVTVGGAAPPATVKTIEGQAGNQWNPNALNAAVGDVVEWKIAGGFHGVRITNWVAIKDHVEVETVAGQHPFDTTTGQNAVGTGTAGQVLLRLKIKTAPPAPGKITYDCVVHGPPMNGDVTVGGAAPPATVKTIEGQAGNQWNPNALNAAVGDVVEWKIAGGFHGVRITNWVAIKDHVEVETVAGQHPFDTTTGQNAVGTGTAGQVLLRLKIKTAPPAPGKITYDCVVHGPPMAGEVTIGAAGPTAKVIEALQPPQWNPAALNAVVGDVIEWKITGGNHGVRITNWAAIKDHVDVETVADQQPFNATTGQNDAPSNTAGKVLLRLKIKTVPPAPGKITYNCIVHGAGMSGEVTIAAGPPTVTVIEALQSSQWNPAALNAAVGEVIEWRIAGGFHGVRITNWAAIKDHVEVETVANQLPFNATTGQNDTASNIAGQVLLRLKIKTAPPAPGKITYNCIVHLMNGEVTVDGVTPAAKVIEAKAPASWSPAALNAVVGDVIEWKLGAGAHGARITNWAVVKDHVEIETVPGQQPFDAIAGENDASTTFPNKLLLRLKIKSSPPGGKILYECIVQGGLMIGEITVGGAGSVAMAMMKPVEKWAAMFPKVVLTNQDEKEVNFYKEIKGKTVIINFMYTTCDGNCGVAMRALVQIQKALGDRLGREVFIYSITLDPKTDTPNVLKKYAEEYGVKPGPGWTFLTGKPEAIEALRKKFGVASLSPEIRRKLNLKEADAAEADRKQHAAVLIIGNEAFNRWRTAPILYRPDQILQIIERMKPPVSVPPPQ